MGTSASSKGPSGKNPLVPAWAEEGDTVTIQDVGSEENDIDISNSEVQDGIPKPEGMSPSSSRFTDARKAFGEYARSGNKDDLKRTLGQYARKSTGKGAGAAKRLASGITAGTGLFGLLSGNAVSTVTRELALSDLGGLSTDQAIDRIVNHLTPESADADLVRTAMNFALSEALQEYDQIDDVDFSPDLMAEVFICYLTDLVFQQVLFDMGKAWFHAETAIRQIHMENELRELIKVIVDRKLEKISGGNFSSISQRQITQVQIAAISETITEWEKF